MKNFLFDITTMFQIVVFSITLYYLIMSLFGLYKGSKRIEHKPEKSFALLVAAHNEDTVIGKIVESLHALDYPKELYDIFVIADNCNDDTAEIARTYGANVFERFDSKNKGKGYALEWMFGKIFKMEKKYDAIAVFDADNLVSRNFLKEMNSKMVEGYKVVQGYIDSKNPHDSWITESYSISFWVANRLFQLARSNLKLSNQIGGTGFVVDTEILSKLGWGATCLTEDLEFTCKLVLSGEKVGWAHEAIVYDEKPLTLKQSWNQRKRWMQGFADVASRFFLKLLKKAVVEGSFTALDCAFYVAQPFVTILLGISLIITAAQNNSSEGLNIFVISNLFTPLVWKILSVAQFMFTPLVMLLEKKLSKRLFLLLGLYSLNVFVFSFILGSNPEFTHVILAQGIYMLIVGFVIWAMLGMKSVKIYVWYLLYGIYTLTWIPITIQGIFNKNNKEWSHTKHTRQIGINEV